MKESDYIQGSLLRVDLYKIFVFSWLLICSFPYFKYFGIGLNTDVQFYPLISTLFLLFYLFFLKDVSFRILSVLILLLIFLCTFFIDVIKNDEWDFYSYSRVFFGYFSFVVIFECAVNAFKDSDYGFLSRSLFFIYMVWFFVGLWQMVFPDHFLFWRDKIINVNGRGVVSLATEPAYFSINLILLSLAHYMVTKGRMILIYLTIFSTLIVAKSAVGLIYILALFFILKMNFRFFVIGLVFSLSILVAVFVYSDSDIRMFRVLSLLLTDPIGLALKDQSFGLRIVNIVIPIHYQIENFFAPNGFIGWGEVFYNYMSSEYSFINWSSNISSDSFGSGRILSIHGQVIFELGLFAVFLYLYIYKICRSGIYGLRVFTFLMLMFLNGLTFVTPLFPILLATVYLSGKKDHG